MVKAIIKDYMPPHTSCMQVELEDGVCNGSPAIANPDNAGQGRIKNQNINQDFNGDSFDDGSWEHDNLI